MLSGPIRALRIAPSQRSLPDDASSSSASSSWTNVFLAVKIIQQKCTFLDESLSELTVEKSKLGQCWGLVHVHLQEAVHVVQTPGFSECQYFDIQILNSRTHGGYLIKYLSNCFDEINSPSFVVVFKWTTMVIGVGKPESHF